MGRGEPCYYPGWLRSPLSLWYFWTMDVKTKNEGRLRKVKQIKEPVAVEEKTVTPGLEKVEIKNPKTLPAKSPQQK